MVYTLSSYTKHLIINGIMSVTFISCFIGIFFFTYGTYIEEKNVKSQSELLASDLASNIKLFLPDMSTGVTPILVSQINPPDQSEDDKQAKIHNDEVRNKAIIVLFSLFVVGLSVSFLLDRGKFLEYVEHNIIILLAVALTEFVVLTYIAQNYISVDPNFVKNRILVNLKNL